MLSELRIVDLGVIGEAVIEPSPGFTVVTGETGAGKTMVVWGLSLLAGAKADPKLIRADASRALVEGRWTLDERQAALLEELGAEVEIATRAEAAGETLIARQLTSNRSRMSIGGAQVPLGQGADLVGEWVTIHGQSEQLRLGTPERQREVLDAYAGQELAEIKAHYQGLYAARNKAQARLDVLTKESQTRLRELDLLRFGLEEIAKVNPKPAEDFELAAESKKLQAVDDLRLAAQAASVALSGDDDSYLDATDALSLIASARKALAHVEDDDSILAQIASNLADAASNLTEVASALASYLDSLEADPIRLEWIAGRRAELQALTKKYGTTVAEVLAWADTAAARVFELDAGEEQLDALQAQIVELNADLAADAAGLTKLRKNAAGQFSEKVVAELSALAMPQARLQFLLTALPELGPHGADQVQLLFSANPGSEPRPLGKVASGGELSRVRLALEVVVAAAEQSRSAQQVTFVFDEVDAGVGGAVALEIGRRLKRLAEHAQVIVVTHLAQVAAFADRHFVVTKAEDGQVTTSGVIQVTGDSRLDVLAKMMGGLAASTAARSHAADLLRQTQIVDAINQLENGGGTIHELIED